MTATAALPPVRVAVVGTGWVATHRHIPVIQSLGKLFKLIGVVDRRADRAASLGRKLGVHFAETEQLGTVPWLDEADAVVVATSPMAHHSAVSQAIDAGKHVLTEKPFAMNVPEGEALVQKAIDAGKTLAIVHNFQFSRSFSALRRDLDAGRLGDIRSVAATQFGNPDRRLPEWYESLPMGLFYDESPHLLYLLRSVSGGPISLRQASVVPSSNGSRTPAMVDAVFSCRGANGEIPLTLRCNFECPVSEWFLVVQGSRRMAAVDIFRDIYVTLPNDRSHTTTTVLRTSVAATWQHWWQHVPNGVRHLAGRLFYGNEEVYRRLAHAIASRKPPADIGPDDALAVLSLQHSVLSAARPLW